jgi:hypothetical protein
MVKEIRIYIEGDARLRTGFGIFLHDLNGMARQRRIRWHVVTCDSRNSTFDDYQTALETHPDAFNVLLVDSEGPVVTGGAWAHLRQRDGWQKPDVDDKHCHLMVQSMETWFLADSEGLRNYYGQRFNEKVLPKNPNIEQVDRHALAAALKKATKFTSKGEYHKVKHASGLLGRLRASEVRKKAWHCNRFFETIESLIAPPPEAEPSSCDDPA